MKQNGKKAECVQNSISLSSGESVGSGGHLKHKKRTSELFESLSGPLPDSHHHILRNERDLLLLFLMVFDGAFLNHQSLKPHH